mgnify:CR=1 FL=1
MKEYIQLKQPNPRIACTPGMCLVYAREVFGIPAKYPTALENWKSSTRKHTGQGFPAGVWVPVWFTISDNPAGHVAVRQPDGSIWSASDPNSAMPVHHDSLADIERYYGGKLTYIGWTEDIEDVEVVRSKNSKRNPSSTRVSKKVGVGPGHHSSTFMGSRRLKDVLRLQSEGGRATMAGQTETTFSASEVESSSEFVASKRLSDMINDSTDVEASVEN